MKSLFITFSLAMLISSGAPHVEPYKNHNLTAYIKSDKSNEEVESKIEEQILNSGMYCRNICLHFVEDFDEQRLDDDSYLYDLNVSAVRHYVAIMKDNKTFRESYWED